MLDHLISGKWLTARAAFGIWEASANDETVMLENGTRFEFLRNQEEKPEGSPNLCLADFIMPEARGKTDYIGAFVATAGIGIEQYLEKFERENDDYRAIMLKILADRLAEAFTELLHRKIRTEFWGYAAKENLELNDMLREKYQGIRPAPGYPACPDHTEKGTLWELLDVEASIGLQLTESYAMYPTAAVSGFYFSHPDARYFSVGKIDRDQLESYAERKGMSRVEAEQWLMPNLGYDPDAASVA